MDARVVILNGASSVGKSSTARALQTITNVPFLHVQMDTFLNMLPDTMLGHPDGIVFETIQQDGQPSVVIKTGAVLERTMRGMRHAVAAMARQGNNLIVDDVLLDRSKERDYRALLVGCEVRLVGLVAPLDVLESRERSRGDRLIGLARWQYERVHDGRNYDLQIDTARTSPLESARMIAAAFGL